MGRRLEYEVKTSVRLNMSNPQHVKINDVIQNLDPKIFKSKNQFIIDAIQFYIDNYGKETFVIKKKEKERAEYIRSEDIDDIKEEVIEAATNEARKEVIRLLGGVISGMNVGQPVIMQAANSEAQELQKMLWTMQMLQDLQWDGCRKETDYYEKSYGSRRNSNFRDTQVDIKDNSWSVEAGLRTCQNNSSSIRYGGKDISFIRKNGHILRGGERMQVKGLFLNYKKNRRLMQYFFKIRELV